MKEGFLKWRDHFPITEQCIYLDHAFVGPLSSDAMSAVNRATEAHAKGASLSFESLISECDRVRAHFADFIGASRKEIAMIDTTSRAISTIASGLRWREGDSVVIQQIEYLSNVYPWLNLETKGVEVRRVPCCDGRVLVDDLMSACDSKTRVLSVSWVQFSNGYRVDIEALGEACRSRDILFVVDANHTVGSFAFTVNSLPIDVLATQSFKWLCGPYNVGWLYVRRELVEQILPPAVGPLSGIVEGSFLNQPLRLRSDAGRFETGVMNFPGIIGAGASLKLLNDVGMTAVEARILYLSDYLTEGLLSQGYKVLSARKKEEEKSGIIAFYHPRPDAVPNWPRQAVECMAGNNGEARSKGLDRQGEDPWHSKLLSYLLAAGIVVSMREGVMRVSPHFYNSEEEIDQMLDALP